MLFGEQPPRVVHARPGTVRVDVHAPGHHDHAAGVEPRRARRELGHDAVALDAHIAHHAVRRVRGVVHRAAGDPQPGGLAHTPSRSRKARTVTSAARALPSDGRSGRGTSSMRNAVPASWIPATPVSTATAGREGAAVAPGPTAAAPPPAGGVAAG